MSVELSREDARALSLFLSELEGYISQHTDPFKYQMQDKCRNWVGVLAEAREKALEQEAEENVEE